MILYTPVPFEDVWGPLQAEVSDALELQTRGPVLLLTRRGGDGKLRVERILSTDPRHFLDARYQPGQLLE